MNKLNHSPHIVHLYETLETSNHINMVLEFCNDGDLDHFIQKSGGKVEEKIAK
jgi:serine/threonine protein kinase